MRIGLNDALHKGWLFCIYFRRGVVAKKSVVPLWTQRLFYSMMNT